MVEVIRGVGGWGTGVSVDAGGVDWVWWIGYDGIERLKKERPRWRNYAFFISFYVCFASLFHCMFVLHIWGLVDSGQLQNRVTIGISLEVKANTTVERYVRYMNQRYSI